MATSISGSNSIWGLSGNDTNFDEVLAQLKKIESTQLNRLEAWKDDWNLRYEAFGQLIEQVQAAGSMLSSLSNKNNFVTKNVATSNEHVVTAVANASAQDVQHTIKVNQMASNAIWANTGHVFSAKDESINTSGTAQKFKYNYAGKDYEVNIPAKTTLDSFASLINNATDNPGIKVSLIQTGSGYVYQVAGKDTGADNNLIIYNTNLVGMEAAGTQSSWLTNNALDLDKSTTNPTSYIYDLVLNDGTKKSVTVSGDLTAEELAEKLSNAAGTGVIDAKVDPATGDLTITGVKSYSRRKSTDAAYTEAGTRVSVGDKLNDYLIAKDSTESLSFTVTLNDGNTREFTISGGATRKEFLIQLAQATQNGGSVDIGLDDVTGWGVNLIGVASIAQTGGTDVSAAYTPSAVAAKGVQPDDQNAQLTTINTTLSVDAAKLGAKLSDADPAKDLRYTIVMKDGSARYVDIKSDKSNEDLLKAVAAGLGLSYTDGSGTLALDDVQSFSLTTGTGGMAAVKVKTEASMQVAKNDAFYTDPISGTSYLEKAPDLVYTITQNDGTKLTLTLPSGSRMRDVVSGLQSGPLTDADGNVVPGLGADNVKLVDAEGNDWVEGTSEGQPHLWIKDIQGASGPGVKGQVATSDNWNIKRAANARYNVDNWPMEMESATNSVSDVIEGVVFTIQDVGEARLSVSTDIASVEQSIQNFLDAVNSVLLTVRELTAYDEDKEVTSNDPNDIEKDNYSPSGLTNQKGGLLTGNYGVQLFKTRFSSLLSSSPPGFQNRQSATDILSGDVLANLANLGIKTNSDESSEMYGLLEIAPQSSIAALQSMDQENYENMINNNLEAVVDFFCTSGTGSSTTTDFRYGSHVEGITKAGVYDVNYTVNSSGEIEKVYVGGVEATRDTSMPGYYYSVGSGDARGLSITIDDLTPGEHTGGQVRIKEGLVQTLNSFFKSEMTYTEVNISATDTESQIADKIALKSQNGALMVLRENYMSIMNNIDAKITREERRLETWEARQKQIFQNLETLLKQYSEQQKTLESQLKQLSGND